MSAHRWPGIVSTCLLAAALLTTLSCIPSSPDYTVTFILSDGISGTPAAGTYNYKEFDTVSYSYKAASAEHLAPEVLVNETVYKSEGELVIYTDCTVTVREIDIRNDTVDPSDLWVFTLYNSSGGTEATFKLRFFGDSNLRGTFTDDRGYYGTWSVSNSSTVKMIFGNWEDAVFEGSISTMNGLWSITSNPNAYSWTAVRE